MNLSKSLEYFDPINDFEGAIHVIGIGAMGSRIVEWRMSDYASVFSGCHQDLSIHVPTGLYSEYIYKYGEYFVTLHGNVRRGFSKIITSR